MTPDTWYVKRDTVNHEGICRTAPATLGLLINGKDGQLYINLNCIALYIICYSAYIGVTAQPCSDALTSVLAVLWSTVI